MEPIKILDSVLAFLCETEFPYDTEFIISHLEDIKILDSGEDFEVGNYYITKSALEMLCDEKYVNVDDEKYHFTIKGMDFFNRGGYLQQQKNKMQENERLKNLEDAAARNDLRIALWTERLGLLTIILVIIGLLQIFLPLLIKFFYNCNQCN